MKHWVIFMFMMVIPFIVYIVGMMIMVVTFNPRMYSGRTEPDEIFSYVFILIAVIMLFGIGSFTIWVYGIGTKIAEKLPDSVNLKLGLFKASVIYICLYPFFYLGVIALIMSMVESRSTSMDIIPVLMLFVFALGILGFLAIIKVCAHNAKVLRMMEYQREVTFSDYAGYFFMFLFPIIGIWFIQPLVNRFYQLPKMPADVFNQYRAPVYGGQYAQPTYQAPHPGNQQYGGGGYHTVHHLPPQQGKPHLPNTNQGQPPTPPPFREE